MHMITNDTPFGHLCANGTRVLAERCDFVGGIDLFVPAYLTEEQVAADMLELGAWHSANIIPKLNGYSGPPEVRIKRIT